MACHALFLNLMKRRRRNLLSLDGLPALIREKKPIIYYHYQMEWCSHHEQGPHMFALEGRAPLAAGRYACCGERAYRFETITRNTVRFYYIFLRILKYNYLNIAGIEPSLLVNCLKRSSQLTTKNANYYKYIVMLCYQ